MSKGDLTGLALLEMGMFPLYKFIDFGEAFFRAFTDFLNKPNLRDFSFGHLLDVTEDGYWVVRMDSGVRVRGFVLFIHFSKVYLWRLGWIIML